MKTNRVIVVGGGIGGLSVALALGTTGFEVQVLEREPEFGEIGAGIQLAPNATRVLDGFNLLDAFIDVGVLPKRLVLASISTGDELTSLPLADFKSRYGAPYVVGHRSDLLDILVRGCLETGNVELLPDKTMVAVDQDDGPCATVSCSDGSNYAGSIVIGADGLFSTVRQYVSDDTPVCSGYIAYRGAVPIEEVGAPADIGDVVAFIGPGTHFVQYSLRRGTTYNQVAVFQSNRYLEGCSEWGTPEELDLSFADACGHVTSALPSIQRGARWPMYDREPIGTWDNGRLVLMGDAAHPMLQYLAQGACQALEDAYLLGQVLAEVRLEGASLQKAFADYVQIRMPRTARVQRNARRWGELWHADGLTRDLRDTYFRERDLGDHRHISWLYERDQDEGFARSRS